MTTISKVGDVQNVPETSGTMTMQLRFAALQLKQSKIARTHASEYLAKLKKSQQEALDCSEMMNKLNSFRVKDASKTGRGDGDTAIVPDELIAYFNEHDIEVPEIYTAAQAKTDKKKSNRWNYPEWELANKSLSNYQEQLTASSQTDMVYVQDFMGQYNSYLEGAAKAGTDVSGLLKILLSS